MFLGYIKKTNDFKNQSLFSKIEVCVPTIAEPRKLSPVLIITEFSYNDVISIGLTFFVDQKIVTFAVVPKLQQLSKNRT